MGLLKQALKTRHGHIVVLLRARTVDTERIIESKCEAKNEEKSKKNTFANRACEAGDDNQLKG